MPSDKYDFKKIEAKWQKKWREEKVYEPDLKNAKRPFYNLMMFPYPSAEGLHVGNMYAFTGSDIYGRFKRMLGYDVFEPMGLDGFGIHSENYALKIKTHPMDQAKVSEKRFYGQLQMIGNGFAWDERLETYDPEYYKWTQWMFTRMWKQGLAYRKKQAVNWCPSCKTVLADEQVISGECERCGAEVEKKELEQWFFRITKYAERLLNNLDKLDWSEKIKIAQRNWIGKSEGAEIDFLVFDSKISIKIFTTRPDTLFGATYMVLSPEHSLIKSLKFKIKNWPEVERYINAAIAKPEAERVAEGGKKTGVELKGIKAINPVTKEEIPIWVADYVLGSYGTGAIMAVPAHDERDWEFAKKFNLPIKMVICPNYPDPICPVLDRAHEGEGHLVASGRFDGMPSEKAKWEITKFVGGRKKIQYRLRDWLISRQRYWGPPIPMIYCDACAKKNKGENQEMPGWYAVPENDLPVLLPYIKDFRPKGKGESPLAAEKSFYEVKCPACKGEARRETDVSDTFLDSAWYYMRYLDPDDKKEALNKALMKKWLPAEMYIGGAEHAVLHLLYVRFVAMAFHDWGLTDFEEPFKKFRAHGLLIKDGAKMSKSKGNVVNPDKYIKEFGADTLRMYLMFLAPFEQGGDFRDAGIIGIERFLRRVWALTIRSMDSLMKMKPASHSPEAYQVPDDLKRSIHRTVKKVTEDIEALRYNTAISALMILLNDAERQSENIDLPLFFYETFLKLLAPFSPHMTQELWSRLGKKTFLDFESWPEWEEKLIQEKNIELVIQVNGRVRDTVLTSADIGEDEAKSLALKSEKVIKNLGGKKPKKIIYVPKKLVNIVI